MNSIRRLLLAFICLISFNAWALPPLCTEPLTGAEEEKSRAGCSKPWLVMIQMAADNDLAPYALMDLYELQSVGSTTGVDVVVQVDLPGKEGVRTLLIQKSPFRFNPLLGPSFFEGKSLSEGFHFREIRTLREPVQVSEERKLREFLDDSTRRFPSRQSLIVIWGHGRGWTSLTRPRAAAPGGTGFSDSSGRFLGIPALKRALKISADELRAGRKWDLLLMDACLMQMAEVATELTDSAEILLGSSQNQDYLGVPYRSLLTYLNSSAQSGPGGQPAGWEVARRIPELMKAFLEKRLRLKEGSVDSLDMGMSAIQSTEWERRFFPAFQSLLALLIQEMNRDERLRIAVKQVVRDSGRFQNGGVELGEFLRRLENLIRKEGSGRMDLLGTQASRSVIELDRAVLAYSSASPSLAMGKRSVSLWIPAHRQELQERSQDFGRSRLHLESEMPEFLKILNR